MTNEYLYGTDTVPPIPMSVINSRLVLLDDNLSELLKVDYMTRDLSRIRAVINAQIFWSQTIKGNK